MRERERERAYSSKTHITNQTTQQFEFNRTFLLNNLTKRRELIKTNAFSQKKDNSISQQKDNSIYQLLHPDGAMPFVIHLLAHMPFYTNYDDVAQLEIVKGKFSL